MQTNQSSNLLANIIKFGLLAGSIVVLVPMITGWIIGHAPETFAISEIIGYSTMLFAMLLIFPAAQQAKKECPQQAFSFIKIFTLGVGISAIAGLMFGIYNVIFVTYIAPDFMQQYFEYYINNIRNSGITEQEIQAQISQLEQQKVLFMNPLINFLTMFATVFVIGIAMSIVSGLFQSTKAE